MNVANSILPGFTAEAAVGRASGHYRSTTAAVSIDSSSVRPQMSDLCMNFFLLMRLNCAGGMNPQCFETVVNFTYFCGPR
jgi:hypothetical protein